MKKPRGIAAVQGKEPRQARLTDVLLLTSGQRTDRTSWTGPCQSLARR